jgi:hypothetical protein
MWNKMDGYKMTCERTSGAKCGLGLTPHYIAVIFYFILLLPGYVWTVQLGFVLLDRLA